MDSASKRKDNKALKWIQKCEDFTIEDDALVLEDAEIRSRYKALLSKRISVKLQQIAQTQSQNVPLLGARILQRTEAALKEGRTPGGRELLRMVMRYYTPHAQMVEYYRLTDVQQLKVVDNNLEAFQVAWYKWLAGLKEMPLSSFLEPWYYEAVRYHKGISFDISTYERLPEHSGGDRSYEALVAAVDRYVERLRQKKMTDAITKGLGAKPGAAPAAPAKTKK